GAVRVARAVGDRGRNRRARHGPSSRARGAARPRLRLMSEVPGEKSPHEVGPDGAAAYPPPYPAAPSGSGMSDDELAAALAAQTAMDTGPITIPDVNSDPSFRPVAEAVHTELPPPVPVPPSVQTPEYVAPDEVAADPEPSDLGFDPAPPTPTPAPFAAPAP